MVGLLELAKDLLFIVDTLNTLWVCPGMWQSHPAPPATTHWFTTENNTKTDGLRVELIQACHTRGVAPPYVPASIRQNPY